MKVEAAQRPARGHAEEAGERENAHHRKPGDVEQREGGLAQVEKGPVVRGGRDGAARIVALADHAQTAALGHGLAVGSEGAGLERGERRPSNDHRGAAPAAVSGDQRILAEDVPHHDRKLRDQPRLPVVVVKHERAALRESCARRYDGVLREQEALEAQAGQARGERERVGKREDDEVILLPAPAQRKNVKAK